MVAPPVTPSPHRFVIKKPKRALQPHQPHAEPNTQQFNATPRFHFAPSQRSSASDVLYSEQTPVAHQDSTPARPRDLIEDNLNAIDYTIHQSLESVEPDFALDHFSADKGKDLSAIQRSSKRRRLSPSPILDLQDHDHVEQQYKYNLSEIHNEFGEPFPSANPGISSPPAEPLHRPPGSSTAPRFIVPSPLPPVPSSTPATIQTATFLKPPRFRPPDDEKHQQRPSEPLPDVFSPQRRGQKFLAGGLAAEVVGWVMNLENSAPAVSSMQLKDEAWMIELIVDELRGRSGTGMTLISGRQVHVAQNRREGEMAGDFGIIKVILAGSGTNEAFQRAIKVDVRKKIRIKSPVWEVVIEGEKWGVAVTWEVLN